ncbi:pre-mRNA-splicing factor ATP-dependent RNA helicase DEAH1 [Beta vulgaris subsp. vulgaris]|uniref:pre-mRNA-splicing factor ATP-dependent RNA helicase DEAH1 n=1 Tax=Beta vulgaris subsp. vulgaris TaxID=3555 RepID=UPI0020371388|nr:pre-mRNA-splicing factor ATP-dependent RNA helicase DEAH1 [Beta vulgaris subsp. vulgaris]
MALAKCKSSTSTIVYESKKLAYGNKRFRRKSEYLDNDDDDRDLKRKSCHAHDNDDDEEERLRDQREREELERHIAERDAFRTRKLQEPRLTKEKVKEDDIVALRRVSRQKYLKKREEKKLREFRDEIEDEPNLFDGVDVSEVERRELRYKKEVYELLVSKTREEHASNNEYRMPDAYDLEGRVDQKKRFGVKDEEFKGKNLNLLCEQQKWEQYQIEKATFKFGAQDKSADKYEYLFEDEIEFLKAAVMDEDYKFDSSKHKEEMLTESHQEKRKALPIYPFRGKLLDAIRDHQVLIIAGETGCGKTTQIPQYLYEAGYAKTGKIGCTQPRRIAAMSIAARVSHEMGVKLGHEVGYSIRFEDCTSEKTVLKYMTDGMLLREFQSEPELGSYSVIMVDEAHERTIPTDILFGLVKDVCRLRSEFKLLISSATLDAEKISDFFDSAPIFIIPGRPYDVKIYNTKAPQADYMDAAIVKALEIHVTEAPGDILIFLTGQEEIETMEEMLVHRVKRFGSKIAELIICPVYANLPTHLQSRIFDCTPEGARKVVLATNIAETSLTIDGINYVIDPGLVKMKSYSPRTGMESLLVTPISKASAKQRAGRSGRTGPGKCFRLYTAYNYQELDDNTIPEIQRTNLANVVLTLKSLGIVDLLNFDFMDPPSSEALLRALELLYALGALNKLGELTKVGRKMAEFPLDPMLSKMIVASEKYKCSEEIITIAAMVSVGNSIFYRPRNKQVFADSARMRFHDGNVGDHIALLKVYNEWKSNNYDNTWCFENYIQNKSMKLARNIRDQLMRLLERVEIGVTSSINDFEAIKKAITAGFFPHTAQFQKDGSYKRVKYPQIAHLHPSSGLVQMKPQPKWVVYHELVLTTKEYMRCVTELKSDWLVEIAPHYYEKKDVTAFGTKKMPRDKGLSAS